MLRAKSCRKRMSFFGKSSVPAEQSKLQKLTLHINLCHCPLRVCSPVFANKQAGRKPQQSQLSKQNINCPSLFEKTFS